MLRYTRLMLVALLLAAVTTSAFAFGKSTEPVRERLKPHFRVFGVVQQFEWKEYVDGEELVKEDGPLFGVGAEVFFIPGPLFEAKAAGEIFFGSVDYDGQVQNLQDGTLSPLKDETDYFGGKAEADAGLKANFTDNFYFKPYVGGGVRGWRRKLGANDAGQYGYDEDWLTIYARVGGELVLKVSDRVEFFLNGASRYPFYNLVHYDFNTIGLEDTEVNPKREFSWYGEAGVDVRPITARVFVETLEFGKSDLDDDTGRVYQPKSEALMFGVKVGAIF